MLRVQELWGESECLLYFTADPKLPAKFVIAQCTRHHPKSSLCKLHYDIFVSYKNCLVECLTNKAIPGSPFTVILQVYNTTLMWSIYKYNQGQPSVSKFMGTH